MRVRMRNGGKAGVEVNYSYALRLISQGRAVLARADEPEYSMDDTAEELAGRSCDAPEGHGAADPEGGALAPTSPSNTGGFAGRSCDAPEGRGAADPIKEETDEL